MLGKGGCLADCVPGLALEGEPSSLALAGLSWRRCPGLLWLLLLGLPLLLGLLRLPQLPPAAGRPLPATVSNHRGLPIWLADLMVVGGVCDHPKGGGLVELKPLRPTDVLDYLAR